MLKFGKVEQLGIVFNNNEKEDIDCRIVGSRALDFFSKCTLNN
jgi:hypothetical protein